jgi:hypothetical protein
MDEELVEKLLAHIETCVRELRQLGDPERIASDVRERRFVEPWRRSASGSPDP